jgi:hypothetical protein
VLLNAVVNWSATFTPSSVTTLNVPGYADITFEILRNDIVIYRVGQTATQKGFPLVQPAFQFSRPTSTFEIASLLYFDTTPIFCNEKIDFAERNTYTLAATNINLIAPQVSIIPATTSAAVGAVTLVATEVEACKK